MASTKKTIAVWFSCGAASAVAAKLTLDDYGDACNVRILYNPVIEEHPDNLRFLKDCESWFDTKIEWVYHPKHPHCSAAQIWDKRKYMAGIGGAPCTGLLKIEAREIWQQTNHVDYHVLGYTVEEFKTRSQRFKGPILHVLASLGLGKDDCFAFISRAGLVLPEMYRLGFDNANCIGCVKANSAFYWCMVKKYFPEIYVQREQQSRAIGAKLIQYKGGRFYLDEVIP